MTASVVALLTGKEFFSSVRGLVILEMTSTIARIVAQGFPLHVYLEVYEHVYLEAPSRCAGEVALFANNRLLSNVNLTALSPFSISCFRKSHSQAGLASVNQHVSFQFGSTGG